MHDLGETHLARGEHAQAASLLERALQMRSKRGLPLAAVAASRFALARALSGSGRPERARILARIAREEYAHAEGDHQLAAIRVDEWVRRQGWR